MEKIDADLLSLLEESPSVQRSMFILINNRDNEKDNDDNKRSELESYVKVTNMIQGVVPSFVVNGNLYDLRNVLQNISWISSVKMNSMARITARSKPSNIVYKG